MKKLIIPLILLIATAFLGMRILKHEPAHDDHASHDHGPTNAHEEKKEEAHHHIDLSEEAIRRSGITTETSGPATLSRTLKLYGKIAPNEEQIAHIMPRFPGIVKSVKKRLGESVAKGELLAIVESNESLRPYEIRSEIAGTVIQKEIAPGEFVADKETLFVIADLSTVWIDLSVHRLDFTKLREGQAVMVDLGDSATKRLGMISYISPFGSENTQTMLARAVLENPRGDLRPGLFVTGEVVTEETKAPVAVKATALQTVKDQRVVFVKEGDHFEMRPVVVGEEDATYAAIQSGLAAGETYVATNSFILKAELGKSEASHEH